MTKLYFARTFLTPSFLHLVHICEISRKCKLRHKHKNENHHGLAQMMTTTHLPIVFLILAKSSGLVTSIPLMRTVPLVGGVIPVIIAINVVLPAPLWPRRAVTWPS